MNIHLSIRFKSSCNYSSRLAKSLRGLVAIMILLTLVGWHSAAKADVISYFNFNGTVAATGGSKQSTSTLTTTLTSYNTSNAGTTINAQNSDAAGNSFTVTGGTNNNSNFLQINGGTAGYSNIVLTFADTRNTTGFTSIKVIGVANGTAYSGTITTSASGFAGTGINFSSITALNNNPNAYFQLQFLGATDTAGTASIDNIVLSGTLTPEPETWAMMGLGVLALGIFQLRRKRTSNLTLLPAGLAI